MEYHSLNNLNDSDRSSLTSVFQGILTSLIIWYAFHLLNWQTENWIKNLPALS